MLNAPLRLALAARQAHIGGSRGSPEESGSPWTKLWESLKWVLCTSYYVQPHVLEFERFLAKRMFTALSRTTIIRRYHWCK